MPLGMIIFLSILGYIFISLGAVCLVSEEWAKGPRATILACIFSPIFWLCMILLGAYIGLLALYYGLVYDTVDRNEIEKIRKLKKAKSFLAQQEKDGKLEELMKNVLSETKEFLGMDKEDYDEQEEENEV